MGSGGTNTVRENSDPWPVQQPFLAQGFGRADLLLNNPAGLAQYYPNSTVARPHEYQQDYWNDVRARQEGGNPAMKAVEGASANLSNLGVQGVAGTQPVGQWGAELGSWGARGLDGYGGLSNLAGAMQTQGAGGLAGAAQAKALAGGLGQGAAGLAGADSLAGAAQTMTAQGAGSLAGTGALTAAGTDLANEGVGGLAGTGLQYGAGRDLANKGAGDLAGGGLAFAAGRDLADKGVGDLAGTGLLWQTARGDYLDGNPRLEGTIQRALQAARPGVDAAFAGAGRVGSGAHANAFADASARIAADIAWQDYARERGLMQTAQQTVQAQDLAARQTGIGALDQMMGRDLSAKQAGMSALDSLGARDLAARQTGIGAMDSLMGRDLAARQTGIGALETLMGSDLASRGKALDAWGQGADRDLAARQAGAQIGAGLMGSDLAAKQTGLDAWEGIGERDLAARSLGVQGAEAAAADDWKGLFMRGQTSGEVQNYVQKALDDDVARWNQAQNAEWDRLGKYWGIAGNNPFGTAKTQTGPAPDMTAAYAGTAVSALSMAMMAASMFSDERMKEDARPVGMLDNGLPVYAYRYKAGGPTQIGVMAQDAAGVRPEAVSRHPSGMLMVNYDRATV